MFVNRTTVENAVFRSVKTVRNIQNGCACLDAPVPLQISFDKAEGHQFQGFQQSADQKIVHRQSATAAMSEYKRNNGVSIFHSDGNIAHSCADGDSDGSQ